MTIIPVAGRLMQKKSHEFEASQDYTTKPSFTINGCANGGANIMGAHQSKLDWD